jgi:flagellar export protein FliJ
MSFRFPLETVLRYRENLEKREYTALGRAQQQLTEAEIHLQEVEGICAAAIAKREAESARGIPSVHLQDAYQHEQALILQRDALRAKRAELQIILEQCRKAYDLARQKREVLGELRTQRLQTYMREQSKREQRQIDDIFLSRRKRGN